MTATSTIKTWTVLPNGAVENSAGASNDTLTKTLRPGLSGIYTIGGTNPDYTTIDSARIALEEYGVCGPTTFNIRAGTYDERVVFKPIVNASNINTITFTPEDAHVDSVIWTTTNATTSIRGTVNMNGADYFHFYHLTIKNTSAPSKCIVTLNNGSNWNDFSDNKIWANIATGTASTNAVIYSNSGARKQ